MPIFSAQYMLYWLFLYYKFYADICQYCLFLSKSVLELHVYMSYNQ